MSIDTNRLDELIRESAGNYKVDNTDMDVARFKKKLFRFNFFRFSFYTFNIFYASVAFGMMTIGSYTSYKYIYVAHIKQKTPTHVLTTPADTTLKADTLIKFRETEPAILTPQTFKIKNPILQPIVVNKCKTDTDKIAGFAPDTIKLTVSDTVYKKVTLVVRDTVKIKKRR